MMASDTSDILAMLTGEFDDAVKAGDFDADLDTFMANDVVPVWRSNSPEDTGAYEDSIQVTKPAAAGHGKVGATLEIANLIEYGSEHNQEFAPMAKTVEQFQSRSE